MIKWLKRRKENSKGQALYKGSLTKEMKIVIVGIIVVMFFSVVMNLLDNKDVSYMLGLISFWTVYMVIIINLQQVFTIREKGIGKESIIFKSFSNLLEWDKVKGYRWDKEKLTIMYTSSNKIISMEFKIKVDDKSMVDDIINRKLEQGEK